MLAARIAPALAALALNAAGAQASADPAATDAACPQRELAISFIDRHAPPFLVGTGSVFAAEDPGWLVTEVQAALQRLGCKGRLVRLPVKRLQQELDAGRIDFGIGLGATPERLVSWRFPLDAQGRLDRRLAIGVSQVAWVVPADRRASLQADWQAGRLQGRLGAATASATAVLTQRRGLKVESVFDVAKTAQLLALGRFDAIALPTVAYAQLLQDAGDRLAVLEPPISVQHYYAPASRAMAMRHPDWTQRFWAALCVEVRKRPSAPACPSG